MPAFSILLMMLATTARHEGSHALMARLQGVPVHEVRLLPGIHPEAGFYFGYVERGEGGSWLIDAAPFLSAPVWFLLGFLVLRRVPRRSAWWLPLFFVGLLSPLVDMLYNYQGGFWRDGNDVRDLLTVLPAPLVHGFFLSAIMLMVLAVIRLRGRHVRARQASGRRPP